MFKSWGKPEGDIIAPDKPLTDLMHACWAGSIKTGPPACVSPAWLAYAAHLDPLMDFNETIGVRAGFKKAAFGAQEMVWLPQLGLK